MMNCRQVTRLLSDSQEYELSLKYRIITRIHVMLCSGCRNFGKQLNLLREITRTYAKGKNESPDKSDK